MEELFEEENNKKNYCRKCKRYFSRNRDLKHHKTKIHKVGWEMVL